MMIYSEVRNRLAFLYKNKSPKNKKVEKGRDLQQS